MLDTFRGMNDQTKAAIEEEMRVRKTKEVFLLFTLGSQFDHLIKQALAKLGVYCLVADPATVTGADVEALRPTGIILSGGPASVHAETVPFDRSIIDLGVPMLGICLGFQLWAKAIGATVVASDKREFGRHVLHVTDPGSPLFEGCDTGGMVLESHGDRIMCGPASFEDAGREHSLFKVVAHTEHASVAAARCGHLWGVQFHPEVTHTDQGERMLANFCFNICGAKDRYPAADIAQRKVAKLKADIGDDKVLLALSGGSDSSVVCHLLKQAVDAKPGRVRGVYIRGIDRPDDEAFVRKIAEAEPWLDVRIVDATDRFLEALRGKVTMRDKRVAMRGVYKDILEREAREFGAKHLAQGTLYTDLSESGHGYESGARKAQIKLHHNVNLGFSVPELNPLDDCVKDGARDIGRSLGMPEDLLTRHPFPGPGLVVRIEGEVTRERLAIARAIDGIWIAVLRERGQYELVWQAGAVVTQSVTTHTKGDDAGEGIVVALWAVWSVNGFTAEAAELPYEVIKHAAQRITNEVREVSSVVYRVSGKPPATIEWG